MHKNRIVAVALGVFTIAFLSLFVSAQEVERPTLRIPTLDEAPALADFLDMGPSPEFVGKLAKVEGFIQKEPSDGEPATQRTVVYSGYDADAVYFIFVAFDDEPNKIRASMSRRGDIDDAEEWVEVAIDTFHDQRRAYLFDSNALGLQWDALYSESGGESPEFDALYFADGKLTDRGYVVWMKIPFKSLRFPDVEEQEWGIQFQRWIPRIPERVLWPRESSRIEGRLSETAVLTGMRNVSPGRNVQLIPYGTFRSFRALDRRNPLQPRFVEDGADPDAGLDAKFVIQDAFTLDVTVNPDFNQVESDNPQITANQRFEVFFPEKRPFFLENADLFETPMNLVFTRRIADPQFGIRFSGKKGPYAIGALLMDDEAPGKTRPPNDPLGLEGKRATFGIFRFNRDIGTQSTIGAIYTDREFEGSYNRVGGVDTQLKFGKNWTAQGQAITSQTRFLDGTTLSGPAFKAELTRVGRQSVLFFAYTDFDEDFRTSTGFVNRTGIRRLQSHNSFQFRPEGDVLISWGPVWTGHRTWATDGTVLGFNINPGLSFSLVGQTRLGIFYEGERETIRPRDNSAVVLPYDLPATGWSTSFRTSLLPSLTVNGRYRWGTGINFVPPVGQAPFLANRTTGNLSLVYRPIRPLRISSSYLFNRLTDRQTGVNIFNNHIVRSKWNWQFTHALSLRAILQYNSVIVDPDEGTRKTFLETRKNANADVLLTYQVNPWTALYVGYNSNVQNIDIIPSFDAMGNPILDPLGNQAHEITRNRRTYINDGRQFFVKFSYLYRF